MSGAPGFEVVSPPLRSTPFVLRLLQEVFQQHTFLGVAFPCNCGSSKWLCGDACGFAYNAARPPQKCGSEDGLQGAMYQIHVDGRGLCTDEGNCHRLVNLMVLHEKHEHMIRRLFMRSIVTDATVDPPLWSASPKLLKSLSSMPASGRSRSEVQRVFLHHRHELRGGICHFLRAGGKRCSRYPTGVIYRWWSLNVAALLKLSDYSSATSTVEFRSANMGPSYAMTLRLLLVRQLVYRSLQEAEGHMEAWKQPLSAGEGRVVANPWENASAYGEVVSKVTHAQLLAFLRSLQFPGEILELFVEYAAAQFT